MTTYRARTEIPPLVREALALAERSGFANSSIVEVGRLLGVLASLVQDGVVGEIGTGCGVAAAWIASHLAPGSRFVTVEADAERARAVQELLRPVPHSQVIHGDWQEILAFGPFDLLFVDAGPAKAPPGETVGLGADATVQALRIGGLIVMDDFSPEEHWPEEWRGRSDLVRAFWLNDARLRATEVLTTPTTVAILATRLG